jgi:hypothetical protein
VHIWIANDKLDEQNAIINLYEFIYKIERMSEIIKVGVFFYHCEYLFKKFVKKKIVHVVIIKKSEYKNKNQ